MTTESFQTTVIFLLGWIVLLVIACFGKISTAQRLAKESSEQVERVLTRLEKSMDR